MIASLDVSQIELMFLWWGWEMEKCWCCRTLWKVAPPNRWRRGGRERSQSLSEEGPLWVALVWEEGQLSGAENEKAHLGLSMGSGTTSTTCWLSATPFPHL